jgi:hypothetical protein
LAAARRVVALGNGLRLDQLRLGCWRRRIRRVKKPIRANFQIKTTALTAVATGTNVTVVKTALQLIGNDCGHVRPPGAWPLTSTARDKLALVLQRTSV